MKYHEIAGQIIVEGLPAVAEAEQSETVRAALLQLLAEAETQMARMEQVFQAFDADEWYW